MSRTPGDCSLANATVDGIPAIRLANKVLDVHVLPTLGGRIWTATFMPTGRQWIWHNPAAPLHAVDVDVSYDDHWSGGWEELFPNDAPGRFDGRELPDHGEWWSRPWEWQIEERSSKRVAVRLSLDCGSVGAHCEKSIALDAGESRIIVRYRIANREPRPIDFLFKQHLAVALRPDDRLELPGGSVTPVDLGFSTLIGGAGPFAWPTAAGRDGAPLDLRVPPAPGQHREFVYVAELPEGWCGVRDARTGARLRLAFPRDVFPYVWLFMTFGGWRNLYTVVLEPCTNMPKDLGEARRQGRCGRLAAGATLDCAVEVHFS